MSLIGSLEDLGLGDILQIISLSRKSGVLSIRGEAGEGTIVLRDGLVRGGCIKGGPTDLRGVLVGGNFLDAEGFDAACERARREGTTIDEALAAHTALTSERIDSLRRECVEAAVMAMFAWRTGEFSFDVRSGGEVDDPPLFLSTGINAQYLAMEGSRIEDESAHLRAEWQEEGDAELPGEPPELSAEEMFGVDPGDALATGSGFGEPRDEPEHDPEADTFVDEEPVPGAVEVLGVAVAERVVGGEGGEEPIVGEVVGETIGEPEPDEDFAFAKPLDGDDLHPAEPVAPAVLAPDDPSLAVPKASEPAPLAAANASLVVIDPDLVALEWIKQTLNDSFARIHIFQRWDLGLRPIRQYLARAKRPVVLVRQDAAGDPLSGIRNAHDFVSRLKSQEPRMTVLWLQEVGGTSVGDLGSADGVLTRPSAQQLRSQRAAGQLQELATSLGEELATVLAQRVETNPAPGSGAATSSGGAGPDALRRLKEVTAALADASSRGEVLPLVIRFAAEVFDRVAMFMVRGQSVVGIAQHGLDKAGGPGDAELRQIELSDQGCMWFQTLLASRTPIRQAPSNGGDYTLAALLGNAAAPEAYLAPIESSGEIVAVLYADNLQTQRPLGDTHALEVVLQHAGLALERAVLERALAKAESGGG
jgi:hypothetical protein